METKYKRIRKRDVSLFKLIPFEIVGIRYRLK